MRISIEQLKAADRPEGYLIDVLRAGEIDGDYLLIDEPAYLALAERYSKPGRIAPAGVREHRKKTCEACWKWNPKGWAGLGACGICNCTKLMWWKAAKSCPDHPPRWIAFVVENRAG